MAPKRVLLIGLDILILGPRKYLAAEVAAQRCRGVQIDGPIKQPAQLLLNPEEGEPRRTCGLELDRHVWSPRLGSHEVVGGGSCCRLLMTSSIPARRRTLHMSAVHQWAFLRGAERAEIASARHGPPDSGGFHRIPRWHAVRVSACRSRSPRRVPPARHRDQREIPARPVGTTTPRCSTSVADVSE